MAKKKKPTSPAVEELSDLEELVEYGEMFGQMYQDIGTGLREAEEARRRARGFI